MSSVNLSCLAEVHKCTVVILDGEDKRGENTALRNTWMQIFPGLFSCCLSLKRFLIQLYTVNLFKNYILSTFISHRGSVHILLAAQDVARR